MFKSLFKIRSIQPRIRPAFCFIILTLPLLLSGSLAFGQLTLSFAPEYFYWQENANGMKLLDQSGVRYGLELSYKQQQQDEDWLWAGRLKVYYGSPDYNGHTFSGMPVETTSEYFGGLAEIRRGYRWDLNGDQYLDLMAGLGLEDWRRSLNGSGGYAENWLPIYFKAGFELCPENESGWIGTLGLKVPVYTWQMVDMSRIGGPSFTLHPGSRPSPYAEAGYQYKRLSLVAFFDSYWFAQSPTVLVQSGGFYTYAYQPESLSFAAGLKVGLIF